MDMEEMSQRATYSGSLLAWVSTCNAYRERKRPVMERVIVMDLVDGQHIFGDQGEIPYVRIIKGEIPYVGISKVG